MFRISELEGVLNEKSRETKAGISCIIIGSFEMVSKSYKIQLHGPFRWYGEVGFEYVTGEYDDGGKIFRKRK